MKVTFTVFESKPSAVTVISNAAGAGAAKSKCPAESACKSVDWPVFKFLAEILSSGHSGTVGRGHSAREGGS